MLASLHELNIIEPYVVSVVDVDADALLLAQYDELVPVLVASKRAQSVRQLCHYFLDEAAVRAFVADAGSDAGREAP